MENQIKSRLLYLLTCCCTSILIIIFLFIFSDHVNHQPNGFIRLFPTRPISARNVLDLEFNSYYIAGVTEGKIYLGNQTTPAYFYSLDYDLANLQKFRLVIPPKALFSRGAITVRIDSPNIYLIDYKNSLILSGHFPDLRLRVLEDSSSFFTCVPTGPNAFILQSYDILRNQHLLIKRNYNDFSKTRTSTILDKNGEGIILTDGSLQFDKISNRLFFIYYYKNRFLSLDTNLNLLYTGRTIDTISRPHISLSNINDGRDITMGSPPLIVNKSFCSDGSRLYIHSGLLANNEIKQSFDRHSVIDVYLLHTGSYLFSMYLPDFTNGKMKSFRVFHDKMIVLYDHAIYIFRVNI